MTDPRTTPGAHAPEPNSLDAGDPDTGSDDLAVTQTAASPEPDAAADELHDVIDDVHASEGPRRRE